MRSVRNGSEDTDEEAGVLVLVSPAVESERVVMLVVVKAAVERAEARGRWRIFLNMVIK